jgi:hypothetical protein
MMEATNVVFHVMLAPHVPPQSPSMASIQQQ